MKGCEYEQGRKISKPPPVFTKSLDDSQNTLGSELSEPARSRYDVGAVTLDKCGLDRGLRFWDRAQYPTENKKSVGVGLNDRPYPLSEQHELVLQQLRRPRGLRKYAEVVQGIVC